MFPKPKDSGDGKRPAIRVYPDGREVIDTKVPSGKQEYRRRIEEMVPRQNGMCCLFGYSPVCHPRGLLAEYLATFEHENGRGHGGGKRDDRIALPDGTWINGAAHAGCNSWKGSRRIDYIREFQPAPSKEMAQ